MSDERGQLVQRNSWEGRVTYTREEEALRVDVTVARLYRCESDVRRRRKVVERRVRRLFVWTKGDQHQVD